jgi:uncharacterized membrane protein
VRLVAESVDARAVARGALSALAVIVPVSVVVEVLKREIDDFDGSGWLFVPFLFVLAAYVAGGLVAGRSAGRAPLVHGALAALAGFGGWLAVRIVVPLVRGVEFGFGLRAVFVNAMFALAFGMLGGACVTERPYRAPQ